jgi:hypothetical protein
LKITLQEEVFLNRKKLAKIEAERMLRLMMRTVVRDDPEFRKSVTASCASDLVRLASNRKLDDYDRIAGPAQRAELTLSHDRVPGSSGRAAFSASPITQLFFGNRLFRRSRAK